MTDKIVIYKKGKQENWDEFTDKINKFIASVKVMNIAANDNWQVFIWYKEKADA